MIHCLDIVVVDNISAKCYSGQFPLYYVVS